MPPIKVIFWDFDGVLMDSNSVRDLGFERVLSEFPEDQVRQLVAFHQANGGLSRYVKFRYFFEEIRGESITDEQVVIWAERFSVIMKGLLVNPDLLIFETINFVKENQGKYIMHITSGSDQEELRFLCKQLGIEGLFSSIHGSPKPKSEWVRELIKVNNYNREECVLVGDSINDWEAANDNLIQFLAFNNNSINDLSTFKSNLWNPY
jgi:phosphoglycolate phosphatase-like HAD superfamily hydrolase